MVDFRARLAWVLWCVGIAAATAAWISNTFDVAGRPPADLAPSLWVSPAAVVLLATWGLAGICRFFILRSWVYRRAAAGHG